MKARIGWLVSVTATVAVQAACSSSGGDGGGSKGAASAQCDTLVDEICSQLASCQSLSHAQCVSSANDEFKQTFGADCSGADQVAASYDQCMAEIGSATCASGLPASCNGVILFQQ